MEKMKEINLAYDTVMSWRGPDFLDRGSHTGGRETQNYYLVRDALMRGNLDEAQRLLNALPGRDAEWYFLTGSLQFRRGWYDEARRNYRQAASMDPGNSKYRHAAAHMKNGPDLSRQPRTERSGRRGGDDECGCGLPDWCGWFCPSASTLCDDCNDNKCGYGCGFLVCLIRCYASDTNCFTD